MESPQRDVPYLAFTIDTDEQAARTRFVDKYGEEPQFTFTSDGLLLLGPVPDGH